MTGIAGEEVDGLHRLVTVITMTGTGGKRVIGGVGGKIRLLAEEIAGTARSISMRPVTRTRERATMTPQSADSPGAGTTRMMIATALIPQKVHLRRSWICSRCTRSRCRTWPGTPTVPGPHTRRAVAVAGGGVAVGAGERVVQ